MSEKKVRGIRGLTISECYKTSDGEIFDKLGDAKEHQIRFNFCEALDKHLNTLGLPDRESAIVTDAVMEDLDGLVEIFTDYIAMRG